MRLLGAQHNVVKNPLAESSGFAPAGVL